jgi:hypothetical protein
MRQSLFLTINEMQECAMRPERPWMLFLLIVPLWG